MPKLKNRLPKYSKLGKHAVVYINGKRVYLGHYGTPESKTAYTRLIAENKNRPEICLPDDKSTVTIKELTLAFLDYAKAALKQVKI